MPEQRPEPGVVRVGGGPNGTHGWWDIEVRSGWKTYAATECGLQLPERAIERGTVRANAQCPRCLARDAERKATATAAEDRRRPKAARQDHGAASGTDA